MKSCLWRKCGGLIIDGKCYKCGRSGNLKHEKYVEEEQLKTHHDWQTSWRDYSKSKSRKENEDGESGESRTES